MPITSYLLIEQHGSDCDTSVRGVTLVYLAQWSDNTATPIDILTDLSVPARFAPHPQDPLMLLKKRDAVQNTAGENATLWKVTLEYGTDCADERYATDDPTDEPTKWSRSTVKDERICDADVEDNVILNTAGDAFDPPLTTPQSHAIFKAVKNYSGFDDNTVEEYLDTLNSATFLGKDPYTVRLNSIDVEEAYRSNTLYYVFTFEFEYKKDGWQKKPLNEGYYALDWFDYDDTPLSEPVKFRVLDKDGQPLQTTTKLASDGSGIPFDDLPGAAVFLTFDVDGESDFNDFNL
jgi:hypothetical protein